MSRLPLGWALRLSLGEGEGYLLSQPLSLLPIQLVAPRTPQAQRQGDGTLRQWCVGNCPRSFIFPVSLIPRVRLSSARALRPTCKTHPSWEVVTQRGPMSNPGKGPNGTSKKIKMGKES